MQLSPFWKKVIGTALIAAGTLLGGFALTPEAEGKEEPYCYGMVDMEEAYAFGQLEGYQVASNDVVASLKAACEGQFQDPNYVLRFADVDGTIYEVKCKLFQQSQGVSM